MKLSKILVAGSLALGLMTTSLMADAVKGQKLYIKMIKEPCGVTGAEFAAKHTQDEWTGIGTAGLEKEIIKICPNIKAGDVKSNAHKDILDFLIEFASDSGNVPSC
jgi:hypothetical protein